MQLRPHTPADVADIAELFTSSVHELGAAAYDAAQRRAWAPRPPDLQAWSERLTRSTTLLAEVSGALAGFLAYEPDGHIDLLYTSPRFARHGVASTLLRQVERALPECELFTEASLVAQPFFAAHGFHVVEAQCVTLRGAAFRRLAMRKPPLAR